MKNAKVLFVIIIICFFFFENVKAETEFDLLMNDFFNKQNQANLILKEIESEIKNGSRNQVCSKQKEAARLSILANESLIKAYKFKGLSEPTETINSSNKRWKSIINNC